MSCPSLVSGKNRSTNEISIRAHCFHSMKKIEEPNDDESRLYSNKTCSLAPHSFLSECDDHRKDSIQKLRMFWSSTSVLLPLDADLELANRV